MTTYEFINVNQGLIEFLNRNNITTGDLANLPLYEDYLNMKEEDAKISWIVAELAAKYQCSERRVYKIVNHMQRKL